MDALNRALSKHKIVPVVKIDDAENALPLADALVRGGLPVAEITFRTDAAEESIRRISGGYPDMLLGAGTVVSVDQVKRATDAGARFIVSAGFGREVVSYCADKKIPVYPGVCTPSELLWLLEFDLKVAKFFPAEQYGGLATIRALSAPFPQMMFMPTGGISAENVREYLAFEKVVACGGSWMVKDTMIADGEFAKIREFTSSAVRLVSQ
jgi:Entner-Doudoroff aldolase